jgi:hypothetical protein
LDQYARACAEIAPPQTKVHNPRQSLATSHKTANLNGKAGEQTVERFEFQSLKFVILRGLRRIIRLPPTKKPLNFAVQRLFVDSSTVGQAAMADEAAF